MRKSLKDVWKELEIGMRGRWAAGLWAEEGDGARGNPRAAQRQRS